MAERLSHFECFAKAPEGKKAIAWWGSSGAHVLDACIDVESDPELVAAVRAFTKATLAEWELDRFRDDAALIVTELAANAVLHARTPMRLTLHSDGLSFVRIEVYDDNPRQPSLTPPPIDAASGRGLPLVIALASEWGIQSDQGGKTVWAELGERPASDVECVPLPEAAGAVQTLRSTEPQLGIPRPH